MLRSATTLVGRYKLTDLGKTKTSLVLDGMHGKFGVSQWGKGALEGHLNAGDLHVAGGLGEEVTAKAKLHATGIKAESMSKVLTIGDVRLPKLKVSVTAPMESRKKVVFTMDNGRVSNLRLGGKEK